MRKLIYLFAILFLISCNTTSERPHGEVLLQPYNDFSQKEAEQLKEMLQVKINEILHGDFQVKVLPNKTFPKEILSENKDTEQTKSLSPCLKKQTTTR